MVAHLMGFTQNTHSVPVFYIMFHTTCTAWFTNHNTQQLSTGQSGTAPPLSQFLSPKAKNWSHEGHNITAIELLFFKEYHTVAVRQNASWL